jgi:hypothetical protein
MPGMAVMGSRVKPQGRRPKHTPDDGSDGEQDDDPEVIRRVRGMEETRHRRAAQHE